MSRLLPLLLLVGCVPVTVDPNLPSIQTEIFTKTCTIGSSCHSSYGLAGDMDLSEGNSYANLVNVEADEVEDMVRVVPGDAEASALYQLLLGPIPDARQMPPGSELSQGKINAIRQWIDDGALEQ